MPPPDLLCVRRLTLAVLFTLAVVAVSGPEASAKGQSYHRRPPAEAIVGTSGADALRGTSGDDIIFGSGGNDVVKGRGGADYICGGRGRDRLSAGPTRRARTPPSLLFGGPGHDRLVGGPGDDSRLSVTARRSRKLARTGEGQSCRPARLDWTPCGASFCRGVRG